MGRIKTTLVKRTSNQLVKEHRDQFGKYYSKNKKVMSQLVDIPSKKLINSIAGYITRLMKNSKEI